jgi:hypothetical protein
MRVTVQPGTVVLFSDVVDKDDSAIYDRLVKQAAG